MRVWISSFEWNIKETIDFFYKNDLKITDTEVCPILEEIKKLTKNDLKILLLESSLYKDIKEYFNKNKWQLDMINNLSWAKISSNFSESDFVKLLSIEWFGFKKWDEGFSFLLQNLFYKKYPLYRTNIIDFMNHDYIPLSKWNEKFIYNIKENKLSKIEWGWEDKNNHIQNLDNIQEEYKKVIEQIKDTNIDKNKMQDFIDLTIKYLKDNENLFSSKDKIFFIFNNRIKDIKENNILWIKLLISEVTEFFNKTAISYNKEKWQYKHILLNEENIKKNIITNIKDNINKKSYSNIDWEIKTISVFIEEASMSIFLNSIKVILEANKKDKNFKINLLYVDERVKIIYKNSLSDFKDKIK